MPDAAYDLLAPPAVVPFCCERTRGMRSLSSLWVTFRFWWSLATLTITMVLLPSHTIWNDNGYANDELWLQMVGWFDLLLVLWMLLFCRTLVFPFIGDTVQRWLLPHAWRPPTVLILFALDSLAVTLAAIFYGMEHLPPTELPHRTVWWLWVEFGWRLVGLLCPTITCVLQWCVFN